MTVLLVDDQPIVGAAIQQMLSDQPNIKLHHCLNPFEALEMATNLAPTVILQDLVMPDIDGLSLIKFYRANSSTRLTPLVMLSSKEEPDIKAKAFALGANDYMVKPPEKLELIARVRYHSQAFIALSERNAAFEALEASEKRMAHEMETGARYVVSLIPPPIETPLGIDWRFIPSAELGGDMLGYFPIDGDHFGFFLLDVTGHGLASALLGVTVSNVLRARSLPNVDFTDPAAVLDSLNRTFKMEEHDERNFSMWYGVFEPSKRRLVWSGGGHPAALLYSNDRTKLLELESQNPCVGMLEWDDFESNEMIMPDDARLLLYSDGVFEIQKSDGETWTYEEFVEFVSQPDSPADNIMDRLIRHVRLLNGGGVLDDDFSIMDLRL